MLTRATVIFCILLTLSLGRPAVARGQSALIGIDGCAILASVIYTEVTEARLGIGSGPGAMPLYAGRNEIALCNQTTRSVTRAFTAALRHANLYVTWGFHSGYAGDYCLSYILSECYPAGNPAMPPLGKEDRSFAMQSWQAVRRAVQQNMALNPGSDVARFNVAELRRSIRRSLDSGSVNDYPLRPPVPHLAVKDD
jgi:hypothetical protein